MADGSDVVPSIFHLVYVAEGRKCTSRRMVSQRVGIADILQVAVKIRELADHRSPRHSWLSKILQRVQQFDPWRLRQIFR